MAPQASVVALKLDGDAKHSKRHGGAARPASEKEGALQCLELRRDHISELLETRCDTLIQQYKA